MEAARPAPPAGRVHKRLLSDQQKRRDIALQRQSQGRRDLKDHARQIASLFLSAQPSTDHSVRDEAFHAQSGAVAQAAEYHSHEEEEEEGVTGLLQATRLKGAKAREWFKQQFMFPEWMVDVPLHLKKDWFVMARPAGQRCIVVSSDGLTVSRLRNGRILHRFSSLLPSGARMRGAAISSHTFCILDCIFHELDSTYYIIDMMCWQGYSLYDCNYEFRNFWIKSKIEETGLCGPPSVHHHYRFGIVPVMECDLSGLQAAYYGSVPFERDGCLFINRHAHYVFGVTPLALLWKDSVCSRYYIDTDKMGNVPAYQQVVLELQENGMVVTCDEQPVALGSMPQQFLQQNKQHLRAGMLLRFAIGDQGLTIVDGRPIAADIQYQGLANRSRAAADSVSKILFQYAARHAPLSFSDLCATVQASDDDGDLRMD